MKVEAIEDINWFDKLHCIVRVEYGCKGSNLIYGEIVDVTNQQIGIQSSFGRCVYVVIETIYCYEVLKHRNADDNSVKVLQRGNYRKD